ncbi:hypothetical protein GWK47_028365 [Chionoecetes opilio]|uniref:Uncharacterized protein n=1 Tax=Chionoecetes opilio TaxID=41210 RepID=A0A8J4YM39_CHIOP|nr:hypothetical protein GWK47_028365 [Chionoecetes opilio]
MARSGDSAASRHDQTAHNLEPLMPGLRTRILNPGSGRWDRAGTVLETTAPRQYLVRLDSSGHTTIRNRRHLRPLTCVQAHDDGTTAMPGATPPSQGRPQHHRQAPRHLLDYVQMAEMGSLRRLGLLGGMRIPLLKRPPLACLHPVMRWGQAYSTEAQKAEAGDALRMYAWQTFGYEG